MIIWTMIKKYIMDYRAPENIYWLFSSSAQAIAAFIGFLTAGFYFVLDKMDDQVRKDPTLEEINQENKRSHFRRLKILCVLTGASIIISLGLVFSNGYNYYFKSAATVLGDILNVVTVAWAIFFIINIIDPDKIAKTANKLIKGNRDLFMSEEYGMDNIKMSDFIQRFILLERKIRDLDQSFQLSTFLEEKLKSFTPLNDLFKIMFQHELIDSKTLRDLNEVNKIRNLAVHGRIEMVDKRINNMLTDLLVKIDTIRKE
jgi:hypothetical protein